MSLRTRPVWLTVLLITLIAMATAAVPAPPAQAGGIPPFKLRIALKRAPGPPSSIYVAGYWNFPDNWAGQAAPTDEATLTFRSLPSCVRVSNYIVRTYNYQGQETRDKYGRPYGHLRNANIRNDSPIFDIRDVTRGFVSQADFGKVRVILRNYCKKPLYNRVVAFSYEANQGGNVESVSAGWGFLSVSYGNNGLKRQQGTPPTYFKLRR